MLQVLKKKKYFFIIVTCLAMIFSLACDNKEKYAGVYRTDGGKFERAPESTIELQENGRGVWRVSDDEASFSWAVSGDEIRLHTKAGGVIVGTIKENGIEISLPGSPKVFFKKIK
jgi:hypothetical protein